MRTKAVACVAHRRPRRPNARVWSPRARFQRPPTRRPRARPSSTSTRRALVLCSNVVLPPGRSKDILQNHRRSVQDRLVAAARSRNRHRLHHAIRWRGRGRRAAPGRPGHSRSTECRIGPPTRRASRSACRNARSRSLVEMQVDSFRATGLVDSNMPNVTPCHRHCSRPRRREVTRVGISVGQQKQCVSSQARRSWSDAEASIGLPLDSNGP